MIKFAINSTTYLKGITLIVLNALEHLDFGWGSLRYLDIKTCGSGYQRRGDLQHLDIG